MVATLSQIEISPKDALQELRTADLLIESHSDHFQASIDSEKPFKVTTDNRLANADSIFIAIKGGHFDGHQALDKLPQGVVSIIDNPAFKNQNRLLVKNSRAAWSVLCAKFYGHPQNKLKLIGITGTNGKTSTVWFIREMLRSMGRRCASIGTLGVAIDDDFQPTGHTTPDPPVLFGIFAKCVELGVEFVAMEVSSHGISQQKIFGCEFSAAGFTSFSRDHLDHHGTMEHYFSTKMELFTKHLKSEALSVVHTSIKERFLEALPKRMNPLFYMYHNTDITEDLTNTVTIRKIESVADQMPTYRIQKSGQNFEGSVALYGVTGLENFCCAFLITSYLIKPLSSLAWPDVKGVPGRLEYVSIGEPKHPKVFVDYAHTPDALEKLLQEGRRMLSQEKNPGKLIVVFGCGGDRDVGKRPVSGKVAAELADYCFVTSDNPRTEDPVAIINQIIGGIDLEKMDRIIVEEDRALAIKQAIAFARSEDFVFIAGKGHESYQEIKGIKTPFDDRQVAKIMLQLKPS